jgi:hypothetical protein
MRTNDAAHAGRFTRQIAELGDLQPRLPVADHDLADLVWEHQIGGLVERSQHRAGSDWQRPHREASLGVDQPSGISQYGMTQSFCDSSLRSVPVSMG